MRKAKHFFLILLLILAGLEVPGWSQTSPEAGFYTLEAVDFHFQQNSYFNRVALRSAPARIWTVFRPADSEPLTKPLFVFFNGGPGSGTCNGLMSAYTAPWAITVNEQNGRGEIVKNSSSWTCLGNLLYVDARTTGFSYSLMDGPDEEAKRRNEFDAQNYNSFVDGADFVRVLLRFLAAHPQLRQNRVVIVGESYGGTRAIVMLHLLLNYQKYGDGRAIFQDPELVREIQNHFDVVFPQYRGQTAPPAVIARQFSHQVLIQPAISRIFQKQVVARMLEMPDSILYRLAQETGVPFIPWKEQPGSRGTPTPGQVINNAFAYLEKINRDPYWVARPAGFLDAFFSASAALLTQFGPLCQLTGVDVSTVAEMYARTRHNAYKSIASDQSVDLASFSADADGRLLRKRYLKGRALLAAEENLASVFGSLRPWDRFFTELNYDANLAFLINRLTFFGLYEELYFGMSRQYGEMFLENAAWVETFVTNAAFDLVVFNPSLPETLAMHTSILSASRFDALGPEGAARPGQILLNYQPNSLPQANIRQRIIRFPYYPRSGHAVTWSEPAEILADVTSWMQGSGGVAPEGQGEVK